MLVSLLPPTDVQDASPEKAGERPRPALRLDRAATVHWKPDGIPSSIELGRTTLPLERSACSGMYRRWRRGIVRGLSHVGVVAEKPRQGHIPTSSSVHKSCLPGVRLDYWYRCSDVSTHSFQDEEIWLTRKQILRLLPRLATGSHNALPSGLLRPTRHIVRLGRHVLCVRSSLWRNLSHDNRATLDGYIHDMDSCAHLHRLCHKPTQPHANDGFDNNRFAGHWCQRSCCCNHNNVPASYAGRAGHCWWPQRGHPIVRICSCYGDLFDCTSKSIDHDSTSICNSRSRECRTASEECPCPYRWT